MVEVTGIEIAPVFGVPVTERVEPDISEELE
jgi:hypothetical protein